MCQIDRMAGLFLGVLIYLAILAVVVLVVWGGLHYFLSDPTPSILPFPKTISVSEIKSLTDKPAIVTNTNLLERAKESYRYAFGTASRLRKNFKYLSPEFRSECTEDDFVRAFIPLSLIIGEKYEIEALYRATLERS